MICECSNEHFSTTLILSKLSQDKKYATTRGIRGHRVKLTINLAIVREKLKLEKRKPEICFRHNSILIENDEKLITKSDISGL